MIRSTLVFRIGLFGFLLFVGAASLRASGGDQSADSTAQTNDAREAQNGAKAKPAAKSDQPARPQEKLSDAERISLLQRTIETEQTRLDELQKDLDDPQSDYKQAEAEFEQLDKAVDQLKQDVQRFRKDGKAKEADKLDGNLKSLGKERTLAKERFDVAIDERKAMRDEITTLKGKIDKDREALADLEGTGDAKPTEAGKDDHAAPKTGSGATQHAGDSVTGDTASQHGGANTGAAAGAAGDKPEDTAAEQDEEVMKAESDAREKDEEAAEAEQEVQSIKARIADLQKLITQEQKSLAIARKKADLALATQQTLDVEHKTKIADGAPQAEIDAIAKRIADAASRYTEFREDVSEATDRLNTAQSELASLQAQQIQALHEAEEARKAATEAHQEVDELKNPFAIRNIKKWLVEHGPRILMLIAAMIILQMAIRLFTHRIAKLMAGAGSRGSTEERENRAQTLVGVFQNAASVTIIVGGTLMILDEMGQNVTVLMGGAAVAGLAVAFGAQNLIRDYFSGFVMLLENQYMLHDSIQISGVTGKVERITLRMTVLRDGDGVVHFIPNGQITTVSNKTHGWAQASFEIGVAYKENVDEVMQVITELGRQLRQDPAFGPMILDDLSMQGIDSLGDSAVMLKFQVKTRPHQNGSVKRELLRRIKYRFDELGIEFPFPHRTIYHRYDGVLPPQVTIETEKRAA